MRNFFIMKHSQRNRFFILSMFLLAMMVFLVSCGGSSDEASGGGTLEGIVYDCNSMVALRNVEISIGDIATRSNTEGRYTLTNIPEGPQTLKAERYEYETKSRMIFIDAGHTTSYNILMETTRDDWLDEDTTYLWQVEIVKEDGTVTEGPLWSFSTEKNADFDPWQPSNHIQIKKESSNKIVETHIKAYGEKEYQVDSTEALTNDTGAILAYLHILNPRGYVIVPAVKEDVLPPVLAYSFTTALTADNPFKTRISNMAVQDIEQRLRAVSKNEALPIHRLQKNNEMWKSYLTGNIKVDRTSRTTYGPLLNTPTWGQSSPYNDQCPMDTETNERSVTGCVATAYVQVINYWRHPVDFVFSSIHNYTTETRRIAINAADANMNNINYNNSSPNNSVKAGLSFACGVMSRMDYTSESSSAYTIGVAKAIKDFGYYEPKTERFDHNDTFNANKMIENLKASTGKPVVTAITQVDSQGNWRGGHAIVIDGYNGNNETFHLNMGWDGGSDGWYSLPQGMPARYSVIKGYVYDIIPSTNSNSNQEKTKACVPQNPYPRNGAAFVSTDKALDWDTCEDALYYNCYLWKSGEEKPSVPTYRNLPYAVAYPSYMHN